MTKCIAESLLFAALIITVSGQVSFDFGTVAGFLGWNQLPPGHWEETVGVNYPIYPAIPKPPTGSGEYIWLEYRDMYTPTPSPLTAPAGSIEIFDGTIICGRFYRHVTIDDDLDRVNLTLKGYNADGQPYSMLLLHIDDYDDWKYTEITCGTAQGQEPCCPTYPCGIDLTFELAGQDLYSLESVAVDYIATSTGGTCGW